MTTTDADPLDRRAKAILEAVRECWRLLSDLETGDKAVALAKLDDMLTMETVSQDPLLHAKDGIDGQP